MDKQDVERVAGDLYEQLAPHTLKGRSWPAALGKQLAMAPVKAVADVLERLQLRSKVYPPDDTAKEGLPWRQRFTDSEDKAMRVVATRSQMLHFLSRQPKVLQQKVMHVYQLRLMPERMRRQAYSFWSLTFMATREDAAFAPNQRFVPLQDARAIVLFLRDHRYRGNVVAPMWDLKILRWDVNLDTHECHLGGNFKGDNGCPISRATDAWLFNNTPVPVQHRLCVHQNQTGLIDTALDMHWGVEQACAGGRGQYPAGPVFPQVYVGLTSHDAVDQDPNAPGLRAAAHREVLLWTQAGRPRTWPRFPMLVQEQVNTITGERQPPLAASIRDPGDCWEDLALSLVDDQESFLLLSARELYEVEHDGLTLIPLSFFTPGDPAKPLLNCVRLYLDFQGLLGRPSTDTRFDTPNRRSCLSRIQTIYLPTRDHLVAAWGGVEYDLLSVRPKVAHKFAEAREG